MSTEDHLRVDHLRADLSRRSLRGGAATLASQGVRFCVQLAVAAVLGRLLTESDYGVLAMAVALTGFAQIFSDLGLAQATVQREVVEEAQLTHLFWVNVAIGLVVGLGVAALAPVLAWFYGDARVLGVTLALSLSFPLAGLGVQHRALLRRQMRFGALAVSDALGVILGAIGGIALALAGAGYWALVAMMLTGAFASTLLAWALCSWRPGRPAWPRGVGGMLRFGGYLTGFRTVNYFARNADNVLIGWAMGSAALGHYSRAYQLLLMPVTQFAIPLSGVAVPTLSRLQDDPPRYVRYYVRGLNVLLWLCGPGIVLAAVLAPELVTFVLGPRWGEAGRLFRILAAVALVQPAYSTLGWVLISLGRADRLFRLACVASPVLVAAFAIGLRGGAEGVAIAYAVTFGLVVAPWAFWFALRDTPVSLGHVWGAVRGPVVASAAVGAAALLVRLAWPAEGFLGTLLLPALAGALAGGILVLAVAPLRREIAAVRGHVQQLFAGRRA